MARVLKPSPGFFDGYFWRSRKTGKVMRKAYALRGATKAQKRALRGHETRKRKKAAQKRKRRLRRRPREPEKVLRWEPFEGATHIFIGWPWHLEKPTSATERSFERAGVAIAPEGMSSEHLRFLITKIRGKRKRKVFDSLIEYTFVVGDKPIEVTVVMYEQSKKAVDHVAESIGERGRLSTQKARIKAGKSKHEIGRARMRFAVVSILIYQFRVLKGRMKKARVMSLLSIAADAAWKLAWVKGV
jgi:hypothetical protein